MGIALREIFARFGVEFDDKGLVKGDEATKGLIKRVGELGQALSAPALVVGAAALVRNMVQMGLQGADASRHLHTSATSLREWQHVAALSGVQTEEMDAAVSTLARSMHESVTGNYEMAWHFRRLGIDVRDANGQLRDTGDVMLEAGVRISQIERPVTRARMTMRMFGESGRFLLPIFEQGAEAVNAMREEVRMITGGSFEQLGEQSKKVRAETARLTLATDALSTVFALNLIPSVTQGIVWLGKLVLWFKDITDKSYLMQAGLVVLGIAAAAAFVKMGIAAAAAFAPAIAAALPMILTIGGLVLLVDDLMALFEGGPSLIGDFLDSILGAGEAQAVVRDLKQDWEDIVDAISRAIGAVSEFLGIADKPAIGRLRGESLQGFNNAAGPRRDLNPEPPAQQRNRVFDAIRAISGNRAEAPALGTLRAGMAVVGPGGRVLPGLASGGSGRGTDVRVSSTIGNVVVQQREGEDQQALAERVHGEIRDRQREDIAAARRALVPVVARIER